MIKTKQADFINIDDNLELSIQKAKKKYLEGEVFIYPTDTIYGFGANPFNEEAVQRINEIKGREIGKMYILLINDIKNLLKYVDIQSEKHLDFLISIWPNPVSVILNLNRKTSKILNNETAAFRIPNHRFCIHLLDALSMPLISTSVNRSKNPPLFDPILIRDEFSAEVSAIFYTEKKSFFEASTMIDLSNNDPVLMREGKIKFQDLLEKFN